MGRKVSELKADQLEHLPEQCRRCLFWELGSPRPDPRRAASDHDRDELAGDAIVQKQAWLTATGLEWGPPGRFVQVDGRTVGYALFAPSERFAPRALPVPRASADALFLAALWVEPGFREGGLGKLLIQEAVKEAHRGDLKAVEAYGDRRFREAECVLPSQFLLSRGFQLHREHPRYPLLRLDLRRVLRWTESLEAALDEVRELLPRPKPAPIPQRHPGGGTPRGRA